MLKLLKIFESIVNTTYTHTISNVDLFKKFSSMLPNTPEYVKEDIFKSLIDSKPEIVDEINTRFNGNPLLVLGKRYLSILEGKWTLQTLSVTPNDFDDSTLHAFEQREFGDINAYQVDDDHKRTQYQRKIAKPDGSNEPVILVQTPNGYELLEGWHRTMSILILGDNGEDYKNWEKVRLKAWICLPK